MLYIKNNGERSEAELRARLERLLDELFPDIVYSIQEDSEATMLGCPWIPDEEEGGTLKRRSKLTSKREEELRRMIEEQLKQMDVAFSAALLKLIDEKGMSDAECYKRANVDRRLFSKIRSSEGYHASKATVLAFAIALELDLEQTEALLEKAGYTLSGSRKLDVIVQFFITEGFYNIDVINEILYEHDLPLLGSATMES
ncbi:MAG: hypothetical protein IJY43_06470 [Clostridia bacterium]|nr:hypothetical protein [Clostridia bacterium]